MLRIRHMLCSALVQDPLSWLSTSVPLISSWDRCVVLDPTNSSTTSIVMGQYAHVDSRSSFHIHFWWDQSFPIPPPKFSTGAIAGTASSIQSWDDIDSIVAAPTLYDTPGNSNFKSTLSGDIIAAIATTTGLLVLGVTAFFFRLRRQAQSVVKNADTTEWDEYTSNPALAAINMVHSTVAANHNNSSIIDRDGDGGSRVGIQIAAIQGAQPNIIDSQTMSSTSGSYIVGSTHPDRVEQPLPGSAHVDVDQVQIRI